MAEALTACPRCHRPHAEERAVCLFCGAPLLGPAAQLRAEVERLVPARRRGEARFMIAILPGQHGDERVRDLARIYQIDVHAADQILRRPVPVIDEVPSPSRSAALLQLLAKAGIAAVSFTQEDLDAVAPSRVPLRVVAPEPRAAGAVSGGTTGSGEDIVAVLDDGASSRIALGSLRFAVLGRIVLRTVTREPRIGAPARVVSEDRRSVLDLYGDFPHPLRLLEGFTDVEGLALSTEQRALAFGLLRARIAASRPDLPFDEGHRFDALRAAEGHTALGYPYLVSPAGEPRLPTRFVIHTTHDWDEWSARAWVVWSRLSGAGALARGRPS